VDFGILGDVFRLFPPDSKLTKLDTNAPSLCRHVPTLPRAVPLTTTRIHHISSQERQYITAMEYSEIFDFPRVQGHVSAQGVLLLCLGHDLAAGKQLRQNRA
jgi:hypothetical protein